MITDIRQHSRRIPMKELPRKMSIALGVMAVGFAVSIGAHYTGACMGMPFALAALSARRAALLMAPLAFAGAALASHGAEHTVADRITSARLHTSAEVVVIAVAAAITIAYNRLRVPTSTVQILVFCLTGVALATGVGVHWATIGVLTMVWVAVPPLAFVLGFTVRRPQSRHVPARDTRTKVAPSPVAATQRSSTRVGSLDWFGVALAVVGVAASFTMGANDVANASGSLVGTRVISPLAAGALCGAGFAVGVVGWGRPMLSRLAFDIVEVDRQTDVATQAVQAAVVLATAGLGLFTPMNQAMVGANGRRDCANGCHTVRMTTLVAIGRGCLAGPAAALATAFVATRLLIATGAGLR